MGPILSAMNLKVGKTYSRKADQSTQPGNCSVYVQCTSAAISWTNKWNMPSVTIRSVFQNSVAFKKVKPLVQASLSVLVENVRMT